ncbi:DNA-binding response regulator, OmpR family, contains REC and winged-helix (wHTH) domain [Caminicella sporogenes DSM 14501]|uniref:Stage 0 sporulation protein A homolog n=1 Tax=Caminicella sporogenes DSM 14501 TaxID=1121266 RepID=A0A1M6LU27_9FIRM|nr:response regulator transcription factor [Caminicella sporogenes]RKD27951.1 DNA-binding response regulator [Caminicella sporogenes]SHJ74689.1 DNA-binding response regulator, OmpR family, contains REC and winged-helix (wHTH) domain [Caminicella sporogenes DSM 14501]
MTKKLLIVDDEDIILKGLRYSLNQEGYEIDTAMDGIQAYEKAMQNDYDLIILDLMLPQMDGLEVCRKIREKSMVPIIILTAKGEDTSKVLGLEYGADDYLTKPFNILELKARIKAIFRRVNINESKIQSSILKIDDFTINTLGRKVSLNGKEINLTAKEFDLLLLLATNPGKIYSREELLEIIWGYEYFGDVRTVDVHIRRLREKIEQNSSQPEYILTKWGVGYYFRNKK